MNDCAGMDLDCQDMNLPITITQAVDETSGMSYGRHRKIDCSLP